MIVYEYPLNERIRTLLRMEDLFERVARGELSVHAACVLAGIRRQETRLEWMFRNWPEIPAEDRNEFLKSIFKRR